MGLFSKLFGGGEEEKSVELHASFSSWINDHEGWKHKLAAVIAGSGSIDQSHAAKDSACELGKWLYHEGLEHFSDNKTFQQLRHEHEKFHQCCAEVIQLAGSGMPDEAKMLLEMRHEQLTETVVGLIKKLQKDLGA